MFSLLKSKPGEKPTDIPLHRQSQQLSNSRHNSACDLDIITPHYEKYHAHHFRCHILFVCARVAGYLRRMFFFNEENFKDIEHTVSAL